ncbi:MAG: hypothetical protein ABI823_13275 [Bryobacteraceae bacterium]
MSNPIGWHEAYLKLFDEAGPAFRDEVHFLAEARPLGFEQSILRRRTPSKPAAN